MDVALVTGTSTGIGHATALHLARHGYTVHAGLRSLDSGADLLRAAAAESLRIAPVVLDVDEDESVRRAVEGVLRTAGRIDVLVNNAGIGGGGPLEDVPVEFARRMFETNYFGAIRMIRAVLPDMRERRHGAIVNVTSIAGRLAIAGHGHYSAVKHALEAASEVLAQEVFAFGIRVAIIEPGVVQTPIFAKAQRFADPSSPYVSHVRRLLAYYGKQMPHAVPASAVAEVIHEAITARQPRLRYLVGDDARRLFEGRRRMTDEEYVATGRPMSEEAYLALMRERFGFDWP